MQDGLIKSNPCMSFALHRFLSIYWVLSRYSASSMQRFLSRYWVLSIYSVLSRYIESSLDIQSSLDIPQAQCSVLISETMSWAAWAILYRTSSSLALASRIPFGARFFIQSLIHIPIHSLTFPFTHSTTLKLSHGCIFFVAFPP